MRATRWSAPAVSVPVALLLVAGLAADANWPMWRGPRHDAVSTETGLPTRWSPSGENLAWRVPYGARSAPVVVGNRVYLQNTSGRSTNWEEADDVQERVMCLDADTGKVLWEYRFSVSLSDVPPTRVGWASPAVDPATGHVYVLGVAGRLIDLRPDGSVAWDRSLVEEFGAVTTHGGRAVSPIVEGDLVIVSELISAWGPWARGGNRYFAFDTRTGRTVWVSSPQSRHYDTNYSTPIVADVGDLRLMLVGGTDGAVHALKVLTGEPVWKYEMTKRAVNTSVVMDGTSAIVTHSEENVDSSEMGMVAAVDATATGTIGPAHVRWRTLGWQGGYSSPVSDGQRLYQVDNGAILGAFDLKTGARLWTHGLGTIQKAPAVLADGKLYVGTENGRFFILEPGATGVRVLDEDQLGTAAAPEAIIGSVGVGGGRIYVPTMSALYAIGKSAAPVRGTAGTSGGGMAPASASSTGAPAWVQVFPAEALIHPGEKVKFEARLFDARGRFLRVDTPAWSVDGLDGAIAADGTFTSRDGAGPAAGAVTAASGTLAGTAQVRVIPPLPWSIDFETATTDAPPAYWINSTGKFTVRDIDGTKALMRLEDQTLTRRARLFMGPATLSDYTMEADVRATERRRQLADVGLFAQQYGLVLFGNAQRIELHPWQTARAMTVAAPFAWKADTWYRMKLRVENLPDGTTRVQGKAWARGEPEPAAWSVEKIDRIPHRSGSPGLYADAPYGAYYDNIRVTPLTTPASR
jgi:outer membrane protein assembly factor BamB